MNFKSCFSLELFLVLSRNFTIYSKEVWGDEEDFDSDTDEPISRSYLKSMYGIISSSPLRALGLLLADGVPLFATPI